MKRAAGCSSVCRPKIHLSSSDGNLDLGSVQMFARVTRLVASGFLNAAIAWGDLAQAEVDA
jgi:hypothetical protein